MTTTNSIMFLQQGTTTLNILNSDGTPSSYQLAYGDSTLGVSHRKDATIIGQANYEPVLETLQLNIVGSSAADCLTKLRALYQMLDDSDRWYANQIVQHVIFAYQPKGSNASVTYQTLVIGNATDEEILRLVPTLDDVGVTYRINGISISFWRLGEWLGETDTATSAGVAPGTIGTVTLAATAPIASPYDASLRKFDLNTQPSAIPNSVLILADRSTDSAFTAINSQYRLQTILGTNFAGGAGYSTPAESSANRAKSGTTILRYTPASTSFAQSGSFSIVTNFIQGRNIAAYATVRNNSGSTSFRVKIGTQQIASAAGSVIFGQEALVDTSSLNPRIIALGTIQAINGYRSNTFVLSIAASAASGTIDIDQIILVAIDDETTSIIEIGAFNPGTELNPTSNDIRIEIQHNQAMPSGFTYPILPTQPQLSTYDAQVAGANFFFIPQVTALLPLYNKTTTIDWVWIAPYSTFWIYPNNAGTVPTFTLTVNRRRGYLVPE